MHRHRPIAGRVKTLSVKREGARWYVIVSCDHVPAEPLPETGRAVGIDSAWRRPEGRVEPVDPRRGGGVTLRTSEPETAVRRRNAGGSDEGGVEVVVERTIPSFVHHRARFTAGQHRAWERWWPQLGHDVDALLRGTEPFDPPAWFGRTAPLILEIGSGMGESTATMAAAAPEVDHLAVEVFEPGLAQLLMRITESGLRNVIPLRGDAVALLAERVPPGSLDGIRIFFPDPWPKRRHHKRRLIQPDFVSLAADRLRPGGTLHLATDWRDYAEQMLRVCDAEPLLDNTAGQGWAPRPPWRPVSKFEQRAIREGRDVHDLIYVRKHL